MEELKAAFRSKASLAPSDSVAHSGASTPATSVIASGDNAQCSWPQQAKLLFKRSWCASCPYPAIDIC